MKIPFSKTFKVTPAQLRDRIAQSLIDGYQDHDGSLRSRPGFTAITSTLSAPIDGIYVDNNNRTVAVSGGTVYIIESDGTATPCSGDTVTSLNICTFAEDAGYVYIASGGRIAKVNTGARTVSLLDSATDPDGVTHIVYLQGYLLCNGSSGNVGDTFYTGPYTAGDYLTAWEVYNNESLSDGIYALAEDGQFAYNFGSRSVEISNNDGVTPWAKYSLGYIQYGIEAPYSLTKLDGTFYWLGVADNAIRVLTMRGGAAKTISTPYDSVLNALTKPEEAYAFATGFDGHSFYVLQFPSDNLTLVYHVQNDAWYQWAFYETATASYLPFLGRCSIYDPASNRNIIGLTSGDIASFGGFSDLGELIRFEYTTGNVRGDTYKSKRANRMTFQLERGETTSYTSAPVLTWQHRDDGKAWCAERQVSLGTQGDYGYLGKLERCGIYKERQHRIAFSDLTAQLVLVEIEEDTRLLKG